ncbi:MAG TPA: MBL fold metallo-hydrolase, partial [Thermoanaerobaculia bacterium]
MTRRRKLAVTAAIAGAAISASLALLRYWKPLGGRVAGERLARAKTSPNWRDGRFRNLIRTKKGEFWRSVYLQFSGKQLREPPSPVPIHTLSATDLGEPAEMRAVWIGHASVLVDVDGLRLLTDPVWSERCSPFASLGPKRFHPPPIALADTGRVDAVVISHDHYDHLDMPTVEALAA